MVGGAEGEGVKIRLWRIGRCGGPRRYLKSTLPYWLMEPPSHHVTTWQQVVAKLRRFKYLQ